MFGWLSEDEMAVSMMAMRSRFSRPLIEEGKAMALIATRVPFQ